MDDRVQESKVMRGAVLIIHYTKVLYFTMDVRLSSFSYGEVVEERDPWEFYFKVRVPPYLTSLKEMIHVIYYCDPDTDGG